MQMYTVIQPNKFMLRELAPLATPKKTVVAWRLKMSDIELWKLFEKTGSINDYLNYACTCESECEEDSYEGCHKEVEYFE